MTDTIPSPFRSVRAKQLYCERNTIREKAWPIPYERKTVETSHGLTFMRVSGPSDAPSLVLLPGGGTNSLVWIPCIEQLSQSYRTYAIDSIYDVGLSANRDPIRTGEQVASWLNEVFVSLGFDDKLNLMGCSHGAWAAAQYASHHPHQLAKLVLYAPAGTVCPIPPGALWHMILNLFPPRSYFIDKSYRWSLPALDASGEQGQQIINAMTEDLDLAFRTFKLRRLLAMPEPTVLTDDELTRLPGSTLFVMGENDRLCSWSGSVKRLKRTAPQVEIRTASDVGHDLLWLRPDWLADQVLEFLQS